MLRLVIIVFLAYLLYRLVKGVFGQTTKIYKGSTGAVIDEMVQDPFCKTYIPKREAVKRVIGGKEILFCSKECADRFESEARERENTTNITEEE